MDSASTACYALTPGGAALAHRVAALLAAQGGAHVYVTPSLMESQRQSGETRGDRLCENLPTLLAQTFHQYKAHIFVTATGIAVRCIAPHLVHKSQDPAVVVCDEGGRFAISLLSGHWGGGNQLAATVAEGLKATAVITTATDVRQLPAVDVLAQEAGCAVVDWAQVKVINAALLRGEKVQCRDPLGLLRGLSPEIRQYFEPVRFTSDTNNSNLPLWDSERPAVFVDWRLIPPSPQLLRLAPPALHVGMGCRKNVRASELLEALRLTLHQAGLEPLAVTRLASVTAKDSEPGLLAAAKALGLTPYFYTPEELGDAPTLTPSAMAAQIFGVEHISVAEGAALLSAGGEDATLLVPKVRHHEKITVAVAVAEHFLPIENEE